MRLPKYVVKAFRLKQVTRRKIIYEETEAIPLIFIAENMFKYIKRYGNVYLDIITELIEEWRKENE